MKPSKRQQLTNRKKSGRERGLLPHSLVPPTTIRPHQTQWHVAQAKAPVSEAVYWTCPPRKALLSAIYSETLDLPTRKVETWLPTRIRHDRILLAGKEMRRHRANCIAGGLQHWRGAAADMAESKNSVVFHGLKLSSCPFILHSNLYSILWPHLFPPTHLFGQRLFRIANFSSLMDVNLGNHPKVFQLNMGLHIWDPWSPFRPFLADPVACVEGISSAFFAWQSWVDLVSVVFRLPATVKQSSNNPCSQCFSFRWIARPFRTLCVKA